MTNFETQVKSALARKEPPGGFADRVLAAAGAEARRTPRSHRSRTLSSVAAALLVVTIGTGAWIEHRESVRQQREAEQASILVKLALQIASEKTNIARERLSGVEHKEHKVRKEGTKDETTND